MAEGGEATDDHVPSQRRPRVARRLALGLALAVIGVSVWAGVAWRGDPPAPVTPQQAARSIQPIRGAFQKAIRVTAPPPATPPPTSPPPGGSCTNGTTLGEGAGMSFSEPSGKSYFVHNNNWNDNAGGVSTIVACNYNNWYAISDTPDHGDLSVQTYLNVHRDYTNWSSVWEAPLAPIQSARFAATGPRCAGCIYNIAFDIWLGAANDANPFSHELMIWTDNWNQRPAGSLIATVAIGGQSYQVWRSGSGDGGILTYLSVTPQLSGTMPLASFFADARARGWTPTTTWQVDFGVEVVDTNGNPERFDFTDFFIND
jgi:hypothetical protein